MNNLTLEVQRLKKKIEDRMKHSFLNEYIEYPVIDEDKLVILSKMIPRSSSFSDAKRETYIVTTMLVQIALDIHESVPIENNLDESQTPELETQLKVLAGDYYSGLYYYLLSEIDDFPFIHKLATAIKEINEYKMQLYYHEYASFEEYIHLRMHVQSMLLFSVSDHLSIPVMNEMIKEWSYITLLLSEKQNGYQGDLQFTNWLEKLVQEPFLTFNKKLDREIDDHLMLFEKEVNGLSEQFNDIRYYFNERLNHRMYFHTSIAEEG